MDRAPAAPVGRSGRAVLQLLPALGVGGVERGTVDVAAATVAAGWRAVVASAGGPLVSELERAGAVHVTMPLDSKNPFTIRANAKRLVEIIGRYDVDIVHARSRAPAWSGWLAARAAGRHFITTFHGTHRHASWAKRRYNAIMGKGERVIAISRFIAEHAYAVYGVPADRLRIIPRGIDFRRFDPAAVSAERIIRLAREWRLPDGVPVVMLPARFSRWKGHEVLIDAIARLPDRELRCVLVGAVDARDAYRAELEARIVAKGQGGRFQMVPDCRDMPAAYMLADVVVSPSTEPEAFGRVAVEGQAMGRPVIASDHGGARETVVPGETGVLVPVGDAAALAAAIADALDLDDDDRFALGERAIAHVRASFDLRTMCAETLAVYAEVLGADAAREHSIAA
ncbi:MAG: glycosyltransferase family 4 protein [Alphaproteobacteria bacterium]|nr:glycosyltransferase family 4 protein [Alphaproteobacteria bacterium]